MHKCTNRRRSDHIKLRIYIARKSAKNMPAQCAWFQLASQAIPQFRSRPSCNERAALSLLAIGVNSSTLAPGPVCCCRRPCQIITCALPRSKSQRYPQSRRTTSTTQQPICVLLGTRKSQLLIRGCSRWGAYDHTVGSREFHPTARPWGLT